MPTYKKINDYTLDVTEPFGPGNGTLSRVFNFAAATVTTLYRERECEYYNGVGLVIAAQMNIMKFSDFDSIAEIEDMRNALVKQGGKPPELDPMLTRKLPKNKLGGK